MGIFVGILGGAAILEVLSSIFGVNYLHVAYFLLAVLLLLFYPVKYQMDNHLLGNQGERIVADAWNEYLRLPDWHLFHAVEIPNCGGDIDHIIVGPKGIFCVETKAYPKTANKEITVKDDNILFDGKNLLKGHRKNLVEKTKETAKALRQFLQQRQCSFVKFVIPVILFADDSNSSHDFTCEYRQKLIVGKSNSIGEIFEKIKRMDNKLDLNPEQISKITKVLKAENRISMDD